MKDFVVNRTSPELAAPCIPKWIDFVVKFFQEHPIIRDEQR